MYHTGCKYTKNCSCKKCNNTGASRQLFSSPIIHATQLGKHNNTISKQQALVKASRIDTYGIKAKIKEYDSMMYMLNKRLANLSPSDSKYADIKNNMVKLQEEKEKEHNKLNDEETKKRTIMDYLQNSKSKTIDKKNFKRNL